MFAVLWVRSTLDDLDGDSSRNRRLAVAPGQVGYPGIECRLRDGAEDEGESRPTGQRISFVAPLGFHLYSNPQQQVVVVLNVWWFGKRNR